MLGMAIISSFIVFGLQQYREISIEARNLSAFEEMMEILDDIKTLRATYGRGSSITNSIANQQPSVSSGTNVYGKYTGIEAEAIPNQIVIQYNTPNMQACNYVSERMNHLAETDATIDIVICIGGVNLSVFVI